MSRPAKAAIGTLLRARDWSGLSEWRENHRGTVRLLFLFLLEDDHLLPWRAAEGLGQVAAEMANTNKEKVRDLLRRLFWGMNDESGNLIRKAPEAIACILKRVPEFLLEYSQVLVSYYNEEPFASGVFWAINELSTQDPKRFTDIRDLLVRSLTSHDPSIRAYSAASLKRLEGERTEDQVALLLRDTSLFQTYDSASGEVISISVGEFINNTR